MKDKRSMPSVHNDFAIYGRTKGYSAIAASAYASRSKLWDERQQKFVDYSLHPDKCLHSEIIAPDNAPRSYLNRETLWNTVEKHENRKDAQLCRRVILGLPHEINHEERLNLLHAYIQEQFISKGMIADLSIHAPDKDGDQRNFHAHILLTMRKVNKQGFWSTKTREWNQKPQMIEWKNSWFNHQNKAYARNGLDIRVDPRTLKIQQAEAIERGNIKSAIALTRDPEIHIGRKDWTTKTGRYEKNRTITQNNLDHLSEFSQKLRGFESKQQNSPLHRTSQSPSGQHTRFSSAVYYWELSKTLYGDYAAPDRPMSYWQTLKELINLIPPEKRTGAFEIPKFNKQPLKSKNKRPTGRYPRPKDRPPLFSKIDLHDLFKRNADHLSFAEKVSLALSYADAIANIRAGRSHQLQMLHYRQQARKTHDKAWKRHQKLQIARHRGRRLIRLAHPNNHSRNRK